MFYFPVPLRKARRLLSRSQLRRACRQPCEQISLRRVPQGPAQVPVLAPPHPSLRMRGPIVIHDWHSSALFSSVCQFMVWSFICLFNLLPLILLLLKLSLPPLDKRLIIIKHLANNPTTHKKKMILVYSAPPWMAAYGSCFNIFLSTKCSLSFNTSAT